MWKKGEEALDSENSSWDSIQLQLKNATLKKNVIYFIVMFYGWQKILISLCGNDKDSF